MSTILKTLLITVALSLAGCSGDPSEKVAENDPMSRIPEDMRVFNRYKDALDKAKNMQGSMEERAKAQIEALEQI